MFNQFELSIINYHDNITLYSPDFVNVSHLRWSWHDNFIGFSTILMHQTKYEHMDRNQILSEDSLIFCWVNASFNSPLILSSYH